MGRACSRAWTCGRIFDLISRSGRAGGKRQSRLCGDGDAVWAGPQVGRVGLQPGRPQAFASSARLAFGALPVSWMNRFRLTGSCPAPPSPPWRPSRCRAGCGGPVGLVLVVDDLVPAAAIRPGRPGLGEEAAARDLLAGVLAPPCATM